MLQVRSETEPLARVLMHEPGPEVNRMVPSMMEELDSAGGGRTCVLLESHEISRARGGPHCLTPPLRRG